MNHVSISCKRKAAAASGERNGHSNAVKITVWANFAATDSKVEKKR
ncbi:hypothetical protein LEJE111609_16800 [Lelliottia jeotgali]|jgi:hypothetical protein